MALNIKHAETDRLARELNAATGETLTEAIVNALRERLARKRVGKPIPRAAKDLFEQARERLSRLPIRDTRAADEILGYDEHGLPR